MGVNGEALQLHTVYEKLYLLSLEIIIMIVTSCTGKSITCFLPLTLLLLLRTYNNTTDNKLVMFSGMAWYYVKSLYINS